MPSGFNADRPRWRLNFWSIALLVVYVGIPIASLIAQFRSLPLLTTEQWRSHASWLLLPPSLALIFSYGVFRLLGSSNRAANTTMVVMMVIAFMARNAVLNPQS